MKHPTRTLSLILPWFVLLALVGGDLPMTICIGHDGHIDVEFRADSCPAGHCSEQLSRFDEAAGCLDLVVLALSVPATPDRLIRTAVAAVAHPLEPSPTPLSVGSGARSAAINGVLPTPPSRVTLGCWLL